MFQPTFGYLLGFIAEAWVIGAIAWRKKDADFKWLLFATLVGAIVVYTCGTVYCFLISKYVLGTTLVLWPLLISCVFLPLPSDLVFCVVSAMLGKRLIPVMRQYLQ